MLVVGLKLTRSEMTENSRINRLLTLRARSNFFVINWPMTFITRSHQLSLDYIKAIKAVLPSFNEVTKWLRKMVNKHEEVYGEPLQWTLPDDSKVLNQYWHEAKTESVSPWAGLRGHRDQLRTMLDDDHEALVPTSFGMAIDFDGITAYLRSLGGDLDEELAFVDYVKESEMSRLTGLTEALDEALKPFTTESDGVMWNELRTHLNLLDNEGPLTTEEIRSDEALKPFGAYVAPNEQGHISVRRKSGQRSIESERTGIAPNLVHSLDALHMRMVIQGLANSLKMTDFWSVHDSSGAIQTTLKSSPPTCVVSSFNFAPSTSQAAVCSLTSFVQRLVMSCTRPDLLRTRPSLATFVGMMLVRTIS